MAEFMTDEDLEALKTAAGPETANAGVGTQLQVCRGEWRQRLHFFEFVRMSVAEKSSLLCGNCFTVTACIFNSLEHHHVHRHATQQNSWPGLIRA